MDCNDCNTMKPISIPILPSIAFNHDITESTSSTIDLMITDCPQSIRKSATSTANSISDHEIVYLICDVRVQKPAPQRVAYRNLRNIDLVRLQADYNTLDCQRILDCNDVNTKVQLATQDLKNLLQTHAPERFAIVRDKRTPWISREIEHAIATRDLAYKLYSRNPNRNRGDPQWIDYCRLRDRASSLISGAKKRYAERNFSADLPAKTLWSNLRRDGIHNSKKHVVDETTDADTLNQFFSEGHLDLRNGRAVNRQPSPQPASARRNLGFTFRHTDAAEVALRIFEIGSNAVGSDGIPISFLKMLCPFILPLLVHLFNAVISTQTFPAVWKSAIVTPIPKNSHPAEPKDFRPISVLPAVSKVLEKVLLAQINEHLATEPFLAKFQSGYRKCHSTTTALAKVTHDVYSSLENNQCTVMVLVDFSVAFNCVQHHLLQTKLAEEFRFSSAACDLIGSFLEGRSQVVKLGNRTSREYQLAAGTPQGSCLSALLFSLYINSLPNDLQCQYHMYADDLQFYISGPLNEINRLISSINQDLARIEQWAEANCLYPNPKKKKHRQLCLAKTEPVQPHSTKLPSAMKSSHSAQKLSTWG